MDAPRASGAIRARWGHGDRRPAAAAKGDGIELKDAAALTVKVRGDVRVEIDD
ncbi:hypothetical protein NKH77_18335 [Streptomyces sp. M19]